MIGVNLVNARMAPRWIGPYITVSEQRKTNVTQRLAEGAHKHVHWNQLKPDWKLSKLSPKFGALSLHQVMQKLHFGS